MEVAPAPLSDAERVVLGEVLCGVREEAAAILRRLRASADRSGWVPGAILLSGAVLDGLCRERRVPIEVDGVVQRRRAVLVARDELVRLGVLALHQDYSTGRHGRLYTCWYRFGSGVLPARCPQTGARVLARRELAEGVIEIVAARRTRRRAARARRRPPNPARPGARAHRRRPRDLTEADDSA